MLKRKSEGFKTKKSKTFKPEDIKKLITEAPVSLYLFSKVGVIFGVMGACQRQELHAEKNKDVKDLNGSLLVQLFDPKNKLDRSFTITGEWYALCKKYMDLRPMPCKSVNFFVRYNAGKCIDQNIGINTFGNMGKTVANYFNLHNSHLYTGHCFRRTSATLLIDSGGNITDLKRHGGWKATAVAEGYINTSITTNLKVSEKLMDSMDIDNSTAVSMPVTRPTVCTTTTPSLNINSTFSTATQLNVINLSQIVNPNNAPIIITKNTIQNLHIHYHK